MKLTHIQTSNFLGAIDVNVKLSKPITLFAGTNYSGKSSLQEAVRMALTGEIVRVSLKKEYAALVTDGQESGFVEVGTPDGSYSIVLPSGKGMHADHAALPYVLDAQRFAHMPADNRRAFLFGLMGLRTDGDAVKERLTSRGCKKEKVETIAPFLRAGFEAAQKEAQGRAREAKSAWKTTTGGEAYGSVKAAAWSAVKPDVDANALQKARFDLAVIEEEIENETRRHGDMQGRARAAQEQAGKLEHLRETAGRYARINDNLLRAEAELKEWTAKVEATRAAASGAPILAHHECPACGAALLMAKSGRLEKYNVPEKAPDTDAAARLPEYERALQVMENAVTNGKRDLAAADAASNALRELEDGDQTKAIPTAEEIDALKARIDALKHARGNQQAAIKLLEESARLAAEADEKTRRAAALHQDVQQWEAIAAALAPDGIPGEMLAEALGPLNKRLAQSADEAQWRPLMITTDMQILSMDMRHGGRPYALLSESEKWRADAMIAEAIAHLSGVKMLILDRFDVLDLAGREDLLIWLDALAEEGEIETALIFGTLKALPAQLPETVAAFWIENGVAGQMRDSQP